MNERPNPRIASLLRTERGRKGPPRATRARVLERVNASIVLPPMAPPHAPPHVPPPMVHPGLFVGAVGTVARAVALAVSIGAAGTGLAFVTRPQAPPPVTQSAPSVVAASPVIEARRASPASVAPEPIVPAPLAPEIEAAPVAAAPEAPPPAPVVPPPPAGARPANVRAAVTSVASAPSPPPPPARESALSAANAGTLAAERVVLDHARRSLRSGDVSGALRDIDDHAQRFPSGVLAEERDALGVEALVAAGRADDARAAGARFRASHPASLLEPTVDDALQSIP